ncbi:polysaccharide deacetylase family protein [Terriglobus roseus]|uniref:Polysaccharide deacetylase n=1 Tax=Terriglobus roseus TaxID=392734 RepID=A0A1H4JN24_9BACT|nr:polysaccharide deacetylase family protein [Terriglobus roseus]SEB47355.1 Polysaccharide deacetylase [Terriglobus roseus]
MSKRLFLSRFLKRSGVFALLDALPLRPGVLVVNHHRIGDASQTRFDRGVFSQTAEGLDEQIRFLRKRMPIVAGEELEALLTGKQPLKRTYAAITFDDGYLDNYRDAFPVLQSQGVPAIFFPVIQYVGSDAVPWWDEIAYLVRNTTRPSVEVSYPSQLQVTLGDDREVAIRQLLRHYKKPENRNGEKFLEGLRASAGCNPPAPGRRFLDWDEARTMANAGMEFGSHTCSHTILSQQSPEDQRWELTESRRVLQKELGRPIHSLAYPVGSASAFTPETEEIAANAGFSLGFAFQGGWNQPGVGRATHVQRISPAPEPELFQAQTLQLMNPLARW